MEPALDRFFDATRIRKWNCRRLPPTHSEICQHGKLQTNKDSTSRSRLVTCGLYILIVASYSQIAFAQTKPMPQADVLPTSLAVSPNGAVTQLLVIMRNPGDTEIRQIEISWLVDAGITVVPPQPLSISALAPHSDSSRILQVSQSQLDPVDGSLRLRIAYKDSSGSRIIALSVPVKSRESDTMDKFLDTKIQTALESLDSSHSGTIDLFLTNKQGRQITLDVNATGPEFICFDPAGNSCPNDLKGAKPAPAQAQRTQIVIGPYQTHVEVFDVGAKDRVEPGKYLLSFEIALEGDGTQSLARTTVISQTVDVGVVGESAILKALSVPSFLLLPGCLVMLTLGFFYKYAWSWSKPAKTTPIPEATDAHFWLASITISGVMALLYRWIFDRWYFIRYGIQDIALIWIYSVALGLVLYAAIFGWPRFLEYKSTPTADDDPVKVLQRLHWQGRNNTIVRKTVGEDAEKKTVCIISKPSDDGKKVWVTPGICVYVTRARADLQTKIQNELSADGRPGELARLLKMANQKADGTVDKSKPEVAIWDSGSISNPRLEDLDKLTEVDQYPIANQKN
jgi:hypothetical protein